MKTYKLEIELDEDDFRDLQKEFSKRQARRQKLPEGKSDIRGAMIGEIVRDLWDYRLMWESEREAGEAQ